MSVPTIGRDTAFQVRSLFRSLLRQSSQFSNYNFREYARRRTADAFREHQKETEDRRIQELIQDGIQNLRMLKRQTVISQFYQMDKLVVEGQETGKQTGSEGGIVRQKDTGTDSLQFRSSRSGRQFGDAANRNRTGQVDHDVFEGLPVRRWTRQTQTVSQEPKSEAPDSNDAQGPGGRPTIPEHPMPRDSHLLTPASRALLRAARAGCIYIRQASKEFEDEEKEATDGEEQPLIQSTERNFVTRKWTSVPKHLEAVEVEFLAKRRPGMPSLYGTSANADGSRNISIYEAWVPEGHKIEGEITDDAQVAAPSSTVTVTPEAPAPGTVIEGVGVVNAEGVVRRPPPPKRKAKGVGKGRRKKVMFAPGDGADASQVHGEDGTDPSRLSVDQAGQDDDDEEGEEADESDDETSVPPTSTEPSAAPEPLPTPALAVAEPQPPALETPSAAVSETPSQPTVTPPAPSEPSEPIETSAQPEDEQSINAKTASQSPSQNTPQAPVPETLPTTAIEPSGSANETVGQPTEQLQHDEDTVMEDSAALPETAPKPDSEQSAPEPMVNQTSDAQPNEEGTETKGLEKPSEAAQPKPIAENTPQTTSAAATTRPVEQPAAPNQAEKASQPPSEQSDPQPTSETPEQPTGQIPDDAAAPAAAEEQADQPAIEQQQPQVENSTTDQTASQATEASAAESAAPPANTLSTSTEQPSEPPQPSPEKPAAVASSEATPTPAPQPSPPQEQQQQQQQPEPEAPEPPTTSTPPVPAPELPSETPQPESVPDPQQPPDQPQPQEPETQDSQPPSTSAAPQDPPPTEPQQPPANPEPVESAPASTSANTDKPAEDPITTA
ncbi:hypothetical protein BP00DRAFT_439044 [Aspergillus indologenus CBS 114.80]|uniref:Complex 1 LYR protein domain-containing protein n=2 Tax=Aspergillus subgen. Circumdati TaxID=2720871 RepID=A0A2V5HSW0_9EURO|nr:hypothetical protein BP00DRAFT_439044 [Aspergillus indologenus CBS 114.80]